MDNLLSVIGIDFGSASVRATVIEVGTGRQQSCGIAEYSRWKAGLYQHPEEHIFRQHPLDYLESLEQAVRASVSPLTAVEKRRIVAIGIDTTGSTPVPVNHDGTPLALTAEFQNDEDAMFHLWKDHSAAEEAEEINRLFSNPAGDVDYCRFQGRYSAEWFWAKILHTIRKRPDIREAAYTWEEHSDWIVGELCGNIRPETMYKSSCAAGHKALWHSSWDGLPSDDVLGALDPYLLLVKQRFGEGPKPASVKAGTITEAWAQRLGLPEDTIIAGSLFDAHAGAVGTGIREKTMVCTIGTSAVDMLVARPESLSDISVGAYGGQAENSILPGYVGIETGQAAFGDIFAWFKELLLWPLKSGGSDFREALKGLEETLLQSLEQAAEALPEEPFPIALDWFNGRRYPDTDDFQKAAISGLSLGTDAPVIYRSLIFGALCGLKRIIEGFEAAGLEIRDVIAAGGISKKSSYVMQMMADVLGKEVAIVDSDQNCALGAAIYAAVAAGIYSDTDEAVSHMAARETRRYMPGSAKHLFYSNRYREYLALADFVDRQNVFHHAD